MSSKALTDTDIERMVSVLLRAGVLIAAAVVLGGGIYFLCRHGAEPVNYRNFAGQPSIDRHIIEIVEGAFSARPRSVIQLGILLLIATPIARVVLCLIGFTIERDRKFIIVTAIVLAVLLYSLIGGAVGAV